MICLDNTDVIEGGASVDAVVDYSLHGLVGTTFTQLAAGVMNTTLTAVLYTAGAAISVVSIILVNKHTSAVDITLCLDPANGGVPRYLIPKTISLGAGYSLHTDGARLTIIDASGGLVTGVNVSDTAYAAGWNGETKVAPSKNAVYDKIQTILGDVTAAANITDEALVLGDGGAKGVKALALGAANLKLFMNAAGDANEYASGFKIGIFTLDISTTGTQAITGVGFKGAVAEFIGIINDNAYICWGFDSGTLHYGFANADSITDETFHYASNRSINVYTTAAFADYFQAYISAWGADGFTITKAKTGTPTGTLQVGYKISR